MPPPRPPPSCAYRNHALQTAPSLPLPEPGAWEGSGHRLCRAQLHSTSIVTQ
ncbi:hypothetical protein Nmel_013410 [Mimus melanotis]